MLITPIIMTIDCAIVSSSCEAELDPQAPHALEKKTQELHGHKFGSPSPFQIPVMLVEIDDSDMCRTYLPDISQIYRTCWFHPSMCFKSSSFRLNRLGSPQARHEAKIWQQHRKGHVGPLEVHHLHHLSAARGPRGDYMAKIHHLDPFTSMMFA